MNLKKNTSGKNETKELRTQWLVEDAAGTDMFDWIKMRADLELIEFDPKDEENKQEALRMMSEIIDNLADKQMRAIEYFKMGF
jgi:hypothetical protein